MGYKLKLALIQRLPKQMASVLIRIFELDHIKNITLIFKKIA